MEVMIPGSLNPIKINTYTKNLRWVPYFVREYH
jgi:hypothetical protein